MKSLKYILLLLAVLGMTSCEKHEIEYIATPVGENDAEIQLHYFVPLTATASNYIYKVEIAGTAYENNGASMISTYNVIPSGTVGKFYTVPSGNVNIKLYKGKDQQLVYDKNVTLGKGKQNVFVYDFDKEPIVFDNGYPYQTNVTGDTDKTCWVKFYNFMYEDETTYTPLKLQYQYQYTMEDGNKSEWLNVGEPVAFGETTGWQPITVIKSVFNSSGSARIDYRILVQDATGAYTEVMQKFNGKKYVNYSDYWNGFIGRRYHHVMSGMRTQTPVADVRQFTAL